MVNVSTVITSLIPTLNAADAGTLVWWTQAELEGYGDDVVQRLSRENRLIAEFYQNQVISANVAEYALPVRHVGTLQITAGSLALIEKTMAEMEALNPAWMEETAENPNQWIGDAGGTSTFRLAPVPTAAGVYSIACLEHAAEIISGSTTADIPSVLGEYVFLSIAARALRKESRGSKPEAAAAIDQMLAPLTEIIGGIWGI
jgi:hypothetical protein